VERFTMRRKTKSLTVIKKDGRGSASTAENLKDVKICEKASSTAKLEHWWMKSALRHEPQREARPGNRRALDEPHQELDKVALSLRSVTWISRTSKEFIVELKGLLKERSKSNSPMPAFGQCQFIPFPRISEAQDHSNRDTLSLKSVLPVFRLSRSGTIAKT